MPDVKQHNSCYCLPQYKKKHFAYYSTKGFSIFYYVWFCYCTFLTKATGKYERESVKHRTAIHMLYTVDTSYHNIDNILLHLLPTETVWRWNNERQKERNATQASSRMIQLPLLSTQHVVDRCMPRVTKFFVVALIEVLRYKFKSFLSSNSLKICCECYAALEMGTSHLKLIQLSLFQMFTIHLRDLFNIATF